MKVVFFGTPSFAANIFSYLLQSEIQVVAVVTQPDKPKGRSKKLQPSELKKTVLEIAPDIPIYQPKKASSAEFIETIKKYDADFFVVAAFGQILKQELLEIPKIDCINVHTSLLPKYRGAAPIQRAIMNGESETGVTIMKMVLKLDAGNMLAKKAVKILPDTTFGDLELLLAKEGAPLLERVLKQCREGAHEGLVQDESLATYAAKIQPSECEIDLSKTANQVHNHIRALSPSPGAWVWVDIKGNRKKMKIFRSRVIDMLPGKNPWLLPCSSGYLELIEIQLEGKKRMLATEFLRGTKEKVSFYN